MAIARNARIAAETWGATLSGAPVVDRRLSDPAPVHVRRWRDIDPEIAHPALDQHYISVHLGGRKQLSRRGEGASLTCEAESGSHSVVPAGAAFEWSTRGPVDFAHVYVDPAVIDQMVVEAFDRDPSRVTLRESLATDDELLRSLVLALLSELDGADEQRAYVGELVRLLLYQALRLHSDARSSTHHARHMLPPLRLKRALDFIEGHLTVPIGVSDIATASGVSPYHFSRAFKQATGMSPYAYLVERRMTKAKRLLGETDTALSSIARESGFASLSQLSRTFRRELGVTPTHYRNNR